MDSHVNLEREIRSAAQLMVTTWRVYSMHRIAAARHYLAAASAERAH